MSFKEEEKKGLKRKIERVRKQLEKCVSKNGINAKETQKINNEINDLINLYYRERKIENSERQFPIYSKMPETYWKAYNKLVEITQYFGEFPSTVEWNQFAKENQYLSSVSIEFISSLNWHQIRSKIIYKI